MGNVPRIGNIKLTLYILLYYWCFSTFVNCNIPQQYDNNKCTRNSSFYTVKHLCDRFEYLDRLSEKMKIEWLVLLRDNLIELFLPV